MRSSIAAIALAASLSTCFSCGEKLRGAELPPPGSDTRATGGMPVPLRERVEIPAPSRSAPVRVLQNGDDLQEAIDNAKPGDVIALAPRAIFSNITLRAKEGDGWITIRTAAADAIFPPPGTRVAPSNAALMPVIESASDPIISAASGAHHYRFVGIEVRPRAGEFLHNLIELGSGEDDAAALPHHIIFDRCYIHGDPQAGSRRGIALNSRYTAVIDSTISDFKEVGADSQAIAGWNGLGPFAIINNELEAAGENLLFGGADPSIKNLVPADIEVRQNHFSKPLAWRGAPWSIKNLLELKNAHRVLIDGNLLEYNWQNAQNGFAVLFTPRNQDGGAPWSMVQDVTFTNNILRHTASGVNVSGSDDNHPSDTTRRILIRNNLFVDVNGAAWGGSGRLFQLLSGTSDVVIDHNTGFQSGDMLTADGSPNSGFVFTHNLAPQNQYGVGGSDTYGNPIATLKRYFPDAVFDQNVIAGGSGSAYPPDNFFPASLADVRFVDLPGGDYRLQSGSPFSGNGADIEAIAAAFSAARNRSRAARH